MTAQIIVLGATGYTGRLIVESLASRGEHPLLAGRSEEKLARLVAEHPGADLRTRVVDAQDTAAVRALLSPGDVLVSTVGPFEKLGGPAAEAAAEAGAHYLDTTGEVGFVRGLRKRFDSAARESGTTMVPAFGYDYVPGMLAGALAAARAGEDGRALRIGYFVTGDVRNGFSSGTRATMADGIGTPVPTWRDGRLVAEPGGTSARTFDVGGARRTAVRFTGTEVLFLPEVDPRLRSVEVYLGWFGALSRPATMVSRAAHGLTSHAAGRRVLDRLRSAMRPKDAGGPDAEARARSRSQVVAEALDATGTRLASVHLTGTNTYTLTGDLLAEGAIALRDGGARTAGATGPVQAFGLDGLRALCARAGLTEAGTAARG